MNPLGGLPRRKKALERLPAGKTLVLDAGNALYRAPGLDDDASKARARFVLDSMGALGTSAMAVGSRDLVGGLKWLTEAASGAKVRLLSANLRENEKPVFEASAIFTVNKVKVGVIGVSPASTGLPPLVAAIDEVKKLKGKVDLVVLLAAVPYPDALQLSTELKGQIDVVLQSADSRGGFPQLSEGNVVIAAGERGRSLGTLALSLNGKGAWVNAHEAETRRQGLERLEGNLKQLRERRALTKDPQSLRDLDQTLADFTARRDELRRQANAAAAPGARVFKLDWVALDQSVGDDEPLKAQVLKFEPGYAAPH